MEHRHLFCVDAWISNGSVARATAVFDEYRRALCGIVSGLALHCNSISGSRHEDGGVHGLRQRRDRGRVVVEHLGASGGDPLQDSLLEELMQAAPTVPSSSSSSMPSLSIGSPEYSSLIRSMATSSAAAAAAATGTTEPSSQQRQLHRAVPLPGLAAPVYGPRGQAPFLDPDSEQAAMTQAILAVISSSAPPPLASIAVPPASSPWLVRHRAQRSSPRRWRGAFRAYNAALSPRARPRPGVPGQRMIKTSIALMVSLQMAMRHRELAEARQQHEDAVAATQPPTTTQQQHTSSQLHHMFSERRRRERLNESFQTLRALLPPGTKKDKATVLANTTEYMKKLIADVSELEERNRRLEAQLGLPGETQQTPSDDDPSERVAVDVTTGASTSSSTSCRPRQVSIRVTARAECDLSEVVVAMLAQIKEMGRFTVVTVDARQRSGAHAQVAIILQATTSMGLPLTAAAPWRGNEH
ncbi:Putative HLH DNA-binding domain superfamily protein [Zea mays]|uniref:Putative HLH DNA-binding domain superfamily protein n=1 Tax=Zea mays TaxID=4577 RepID=A0A1D6P259_MAIZE|nr:Putative HLH DNA-binding domain superfamily protein [Zea mays]